MKKIASSTVPNRLSNRVPQDKPTDPLARARENYFRAADKALEKIRLQYGEGPEGLRNFLNSKRDMESVKPPKKNSN